MTQERFPQPTPMNAAVEQNLAPADSFVKDEASLQQALHYFNDQEAKWILDPSAVEVEQPANQEELIDSLDSMLKAQPDGEQLSKMLRSNLAAIRMMVDSDSYGAASLYIKAGYDMKERMRTGLSRAEYDTLRRNSYTDVEYIEDPDQPNIMLIGLLEATGAEIIRDDIADGNASGTRIYKGMFEGKPLYFREYLSKLTVEENGEQKDLIGRSVTVETKLAARQSLNRFSEKDTQVLTSAGIELPSLSGSDYNKNTYPNRSRVLDTLKFYDAMNQPEVPDSEETYAATQAKAIIELAALEDLLKLQAERDSQEEAAIKKFRQSGGSEESIQHRLAVIQRMKEAELKRGHLFPSVAGFYLFESLSKGRPELDMGLGSGFEQGETVKVKNTNTLEPGWTFLGINPTTGLAEVGQSVINPKTKTIERFYNAIPVDQLREANSKA